MATIFNDATNYNQRVTICRAFKAAGGALEASEEPAKSDLASSGGMAKVACGPLLLALLPLVLRACKDTVPNVRFAAVKAIIAVAPSLDAATASGQIKPALSALLGDRDSDVKWFAQAALEKF